MVGWVDGRKPAIKTDLPATYNAVGQLIAISAPNSAYGYTYALGEQLTSL